ncbi:MAG: NADP-dependent malic enzyme [Candidatus Hydrogenedentes bacterium]|nr:NADP-dependent malic enzyme [Candidatus Hydrogenedentota bacterium]
MPDNTTERIGQESLELHRELKGKISVASKTPVTTKRELALAYTPGVATPCLRIHDEPSAIYDYCAKSNMVAVVTDGSAVLGLGNIGAAAALPVMEGKAVLFKEFGGVDAFPICLTTQSSDEIVETVERISPVFGGINLEDISSPRCFEIERRLDESLDIPVFHDDQHGTAIVVAAALLNAAAVIGRELADMKVAVVGAGAAGVAVSKLLMSIGVGRILVCDRRGIIAPGRTDGMNPVKEELARLTNPDGMTGSLADAMAGADVFIGLSGPGIVSRDMVETMADDSIVFAMSNPVPEIMPDEAVAAGAAVVGTGRSDFANQINNVLAFPGVFRGALDVRASSISPGMKVAAARALAGVLDENERAREKVLPEPFDSRVAESVARAVACRAREEGLNRI